MNHPLYRRYLRELLLRGLGLGVGLGVVLGGFLEVFTFPVEGALVVGGGHMVLGLVVLLLESRFRVFLRRVAERDPRWADLLATAREFAQHPPPPLFRAHLARLMETHPLPHRVLPPFHRELGVLLVGLVLVGAGARMERFQDDILFYAERIKVVPPVALEGEEVEIWRTPPERLPIRVGERELHPSFREGRAVYRFRPPGPGWYEIQGRTTRLLFRVLPRPALDQVLLLAHPPHYTGLPPSRYRAGREAYLPEGSTLQIVVHVTDTLWKGLRVETDTVWTWFCPCEDTLFLGTLETDSLIVRWSLHGLRTFEAPPLVIRTLRDRPPRITVSPVFVRADQAETLVVHLVAVDNFGLRRVVVKEQSPWGSRRSVRPLTGGTEWQGRDTLDLSALALLPGDTLFRIYAAVDVAGKRGTPETLRVVYPDLVSLAELDGQDLDAPENELERAREEVQRLREEILTRREVSPSSQEALESLAERQEQVVQSLEKRAEQLSQALEALSRLQQLDPRLVQELQAVAELLQETLTEELRKALENVRRELGEKPSPEAMNRALEALEKAQERTLARLQAFKELLKALRQFREMERLSQEIRELRNREFQVESQALGDTPLDSLHARQAEIARQAARMKPRLPDSLKGVMDQALRAMEQAQTAMRQGDRSRANARAREAREVLEDLQKTLEREMQARSGDLMEQTRRALEEARWRLLGFASFHAETTRVAPTVLEGIVREVREASPLLFFSAFRVWQALAQAVQDLDHGNHPGARRLIHLAILALFEVQNQIARQPARGSKSLEQMVQQLLQGLRQSQQAMEGMMPLPVPIPREGQGTLEALAREMEALRRQAEALRQELGEGSPARDALGDLSRALEENLRKLRSGRLSRSDVERQKQATRKFLQALRAMHRKGFRARRRSTPGKPFTPIPPQREALDPLLEVLRRQAMNEALPPSLREVYRRLLQEWTTPSS